MDSVQTYNEDFKRSAVEKLLSLNSHGLRSTSAKLGIPQSTLYGWKKKYANTHSMVKSKKNVTEWTPEKKLEAIAKTYSMSEQEFGEYLRANGLHSTDIESFKAEFYSAVKKEKGRPALDPEVVELRKQEKQLKRDLKNTQKALAEQSARIILLKKSHEIWGTKEDDD